MAAGNEVKNEGDGLLKSFIEDIKGEIEKFNSWITEKGVPFWLVVMGVVYVLGFKYDAETRLLAGRYHNLAKAHLTDFRTKARFCGIVYVALSVLSVLLGGVLFIWILQSSLVGAWLIFLPMAILGLLVIIIGSIANETVKSEKTEGGKSKSRKSQGFLRGPAKAINIAVLIFCVAFGAWALKLDIGRDFYAVALLTANIILGVASFAVVIFKATNVLYYMAIVYLIIHCVLYVFGLMDFLQRLRADYAQERLYSKMEGTLVAIPKESKLPLFQKKGRKGVRFIGKSDSSDVGEVIVFDDHGFVPYGAGESFIGVLLPTDGVFIGRKDKKLYTPLRLVITYQWGRPPVDTVKVVVTRVDTVVVDPRQSLLAVPAGYVVVWRGQVNGWMDTELTVEEVYGKKCVIYPCGQTQTRLGRMNPPANSMPQWQEQDGAACYLEPQMVAANRTFRIWINSHTPKEVMIIKKV